MKIDLEKVYDDKNFSQFLVRVLPNQAVKQMYAVYHSINQPYLNEEQVAEIGKKLIASSEMGQKPWE